MLILKNLMTLIKKENVIHNLMHPRQHNYNTFMLAGVTPGCVCARTCVHA